MELSINPFHVCECYFFPQYHLVEGANEEGVKESSMEDGQTDHPANEFEVVEMFRVDPRVRIDLQRVVVVRRVLKQAIERVEHLVGQEEEEFSADKLAQVPDHVG